MKNNLSVPKAAALLGVGQQCVRQGLKTGKLPIGTAVKMDSGKWRYIIPVKRFEEYTGIEVEA